ncbi:MAG TPA: SDR family oxidoreductase [Candidatus Woesebacteria bacterium]|mgnify:CR=1 FL=1|nr:SDR family oxidoreductase [Candidatus Woesebacteria bacterium]
MSKIPLIGTGLNGLVGSKFVTDFSNRYDFDNLDLRNSIRPIDITDEKQVLAVLSRSKAKFVVHMAAFTDVTAAWKQTNDQNGLCYLVNVRGTQNLVKACDKTGKHLIHLSTAYVFDGLKKEMYLETDPTNPIEWYGKTKALAEEIIISSNINWTILRIDQPFRNDPFPKIDTLHRIIEGISSGQLYPQFSDHFFGPTYINDLAKIIDLIIRQKITGLYHATSGESWSDFTFAQLINEHFGFNFDLKEGSLAKYLATNNRPYQKNTALNTDQIKKHLDFKLKTVKQAIAETII